MARTKLILVLCYVVAFAAGATAGFVVRRQEQPSHPSSRLMDELHLTDPQREQMRKVWSEVMEASGRGFDQRRSAADERDKQIEALLTPEQKAQYDQIKDAYEKKLNELSEKRKTAFDQAVERTKKEILTPEQALKYDEILKKQRERGFGGPRPHGEGYGGLEGPPPSPGDGPGPWGRRRGGPRSRPTTEESNTPRVGE